MDVCIVLVVYLSECWFGFVCMCYSLTHSPISVSQSDRSIGSLSLSIDDIYISVTNTVRWRFFVVVVASRGLIIYLRHASVDVIRRRGGPARDHLSPRRCLGFGWQTPLSICFLWVFSPCHCRLFLCVAHRKRIKASGGSD